MSIVSFEQKCRGAVLCQVTLKERIEDDDWDALRALVHRAAPTVKQEDDNVPFPVVEVPIKDVWPLQKTISRRFRKGFLRENGTLGPPEIHRRVPWMTMVCGKFHFAQWDLSSN